MVRIAYRKDNPAAIALHLSNTRIIGVSCRITLNFSAYKNIHSVKLQNNKNKAKKTAGA